MQLPLLRGSQSSVNQKKKRNNSAYVNKKLRKLDCTIIGVKMVITIPPSHSFNFLKVLWQMDQRKGGIKKGQEEAAKYTYITFNAKSRGTASEMMMRRKQSRTTQHKHHPPKSAVLYVQSSLHYLLSLTSQSLCLLWIRSRCNRFFFLLFIS